MDEEEEELRGKNGSAKGDSVLLLPFGSDGCK